MQTQGVNSQRKVKGNSPNNTMTTGILPIVQEETTGCGLACIAMLTGSSYGQIKKTASSLGIHVDDPRLWSDTAYMRTLLRHYHLLPSLQEIPFRTWSTLPSLALLAIKWHLQAQRPSWHWVVYHSNHGDAVVLDPKKGLRNNRRTDFGRMKPKWYITVQRQNPHP